MPCGCCERVKPTRGRKSYEGMKRTDCFTVSELLLHTHSICYTDLRQNALFHNFSRQIALIQYSEDDANGGTQFSVYNYFFVQISVNYYFLANSQLTTNFG